MFACTQASNLTVHAFEPIPPTFQRLRHHLDQIAGHQICCHPWALAAQPEEAGKIVYYVDCAGESTRHPLERARQVKVLQDMSFELFCDSLVQQNLNINVNDDETRAELADFWQNMRKQTQKSNHIDYHCKVRSLNQCMSEFLVDHATLDLLKIDVEGDELSVLQGVTQADWKRIRQVVLEVCDDRPPPDARGAGQNAPGPVPLLDLVTATSRLHAVSSLLLDAGFNVHLCRQRSTLYPDGFLHFVPDQLRLFYIYATRP
eukprot:gb/GEZN01009809.1/.p1 GENE.gb/GEZN01009809.1/~~gb/GEZN01009809.1/.p1  ORF type:complete len:260 (+),score=16.43 gb/GEZN01009809.1/:314-1093(+)